MGSAMTLSTPQDQVEALIQQVAEESGLEVMDQLKDLHAPSTSIRSGAAGESSREDELSRRLVIQVFELGFLNERFVAVM